MRKSFYLIGCLFILLALVPGMNGGGAVQAAAGKTISTISVGKLKAGQTTIEIIEPQLTNWGSAAVFSFRVRVMNNSSQPEKLMRFDFKVATGQGASIAAKLATKETSTTIKPNSYQEYQYYAEVTSRETLGSLKLVVSEWNIRYDGFTKKLGVIAIPSAYRPAAGQGISKTTQINRQQVNLSTNNFYAFEQSKHVSLTLALHVHNWGTSQLVMPQYAYYLKSAEGVLYELKQIEGAAPAIEPKGQRTLMLYTKVPDKMGNQKFQLLIAQKAGGETGAYATQYGFDLGAPKSWKAMKPSSSPVSVAFNEGRFTFSLDQAASANYDGDGTARIAAAFQIRNTQQISLPLPQLTAFYDIGGKRYDVELTLENGSERLLPGAAANAHIIAEIPYGMIAGKKTLYVMEVMAEGESPVYRPLFAYQVEQQAAVKEESNALYAYQFIEKHGSQLRLNIESIAVQKSGSQQMISGMINIENIGSRSVQLGQYRVSLMTGTGVTYSEEAGGSSGSGTILQPGFAHSKTFEIALPAGDSLTQALVKLEEAVMDNNDDFYRPVASFAISSAGALAAAQDRWSDFTSDSGKYRMKTVSTNRLPLDDKDLIVTEVLVKGSSRAALPPPRLSASYILDGQTKIEAVIVPMDDIATTSGQTLTYQVIGELPYSSVVRKATLSISDEGGDRKNILQFDVSGISPVRSYTGDELYNAGAIGNSSEVKVLHVQTYTGEREDLIEVQFLQKSLNKRSVQPNQLVGYLMGAEAEEIYYPLAFSEQNSKMNNGEYAVLSATAKVPAGTKSGSLQLLLGQSVSGGKLAKGNGASSGYVRAVRYSLPVEAEAAAANTLKTLEFSPYVLTVHYVKPKLSTGILTYEFEAELAKKMDFQYFGARHELVVELVDSKGNKSEESFPINSAGSGQQLRLGKAVYELQALAFEAAVKVNFYVRLDGYKRLIASSSLNN